MSIKNSVLLFNILIINMFFVSCSSVTLEDELEEWCNCEKEALENPNKYEACNNLMLEIAQKYEFDPSSVKMIQKKVQNCK